MSGCMNRATLIGNLTRDPEVRRTSSGDAVVNLNLATNETWKDRDGNKKERAEFHKIVVWNEHLGKFAEKFLRKGARCLIEGQIQTRKFTDKDGADRSVTEIVLQKFNGNILLLDSASSRTSDTGGSGDEMDDGSSIPF